MRVKIDNFHGIRPRLHPSLLEQGMATRAHNCRLKNGKLVPLREPARAANSRTYKCGDLDSLADATSIHAWKVRTSAGPEVRFLAFKGVTWMSEGNIADDEYDRVFITGDTGVDFTSVGGETASDTPAVFLFSRSANSYIARTLVKEAPQSITASLADGQSLAQGQTVFYTAFFAAWFDESGYESPLSPSSEIIQINAGSTVSFEVAGVPAEATGVRVYMTRSGTDEASDGIQFIFDKQLDNTHGATVDFTFAVDPEDAGEQAPGIESIPTDLRCIQHVSGDFYTGFSASNPKTVMFSDIGIVTSWPVAYRYDVKDNIVALATTANSVYALTDGWPWVLSGTSPESMTATKLAGPAACVSPRGVCVYRNAVYFVSNEGLMSIQNSADAGTVCVNVTQTVFTKDQWLALNPSSCVMMQHDGALFMFFRAQDGTPMEGLVIDLAEGADAVTTHEESARCACVDVSEDKMYFVRDLGEEE